MELTPFIFYALAAILVFAALRVITARNPVYAVLYLILAFFTTAMIWMLLEAEFLALVLVMVYIGAVMVLFLFVVMMLDIDLDRIRQGFWRYLPLGVLMGLVMLIEMGVVLGGRYFQIAQDSVARAPASYSNTRTLGFLLTTEYAYPFELAAVVLLVAIVAAVALTFRKREQIHRNDPAAQIRVDASERLRVISMPTEKEE